MIAFIQCYSPLSGILTALNRFVFFSACWVRLGVSIYNQMSSDMNYRIFKVHISNIYIYVIFFACAYTWGTLSHTKDLWSAQNLTLEKFQDVHKEN